MNQSCKEECISARVCLCGSGCCIDAIGFPRISVQPIGNQSRRNRAKRVAHTLASTAHGGSCCTVSGTKADNSACNSTRNTCGIQKNVLNDDLQAHNETMGSEASLNLCYSRNNGEPAQSSLGPLCDLHHTRAIYIVPTNLHISASAEDKTTKLKHADKQEMATRFQPPWRR